MYSEPVPLFLQVARVSDDTGGGTQQLPFIHLLCDQIAGQRLLPLTEIWSFSTMIIITFSIITSIFIIFIIWYSIIAFPLKVA